MESGFEHTHFLLLPIDRSLEIRATAFHSLHEPIIGKALCHIETVRSNNRSLQSNVIHSEGATEPRKRKVNHNHTEAAMVEEKYIAATSL
jgi:hypothetical protein